MTTQGGVRAAVAGELCTCGRPAAQVILAEPGDPWGDTGYCGLDDGGAPADGVCTFCGDTIDHDAYGRAEQAAGRPYLAYVTDGRPRVGAARSTGSSSPTRPDVHPSRCSGSTPTPTGSRAPRAVIRSVELDAIIVDAPTHRRDRRGRSGQ